MKIREPFDDAVEREENALRFVITAVAAMNKNAAIMTPIAKFAATMMRKEIDQSVNDLHFTSFLLLYLDRTRRRMKAK